MKNILTFCALYLAVSSCDETPPPIDYGTGGIQLADTTYVLGNTQRSDAQEKGILIEEFSGVKCVNCPAAHKEAKRIIDENPEARVFVATLHPLSIANQTSAFEGEQHLSNEFSENIMNYILGKPDGIPAGSVDRYIFQGQTKRIALGFSSWGNFVKERLNLTTPINIKSVYTIDTSNQSIVVKSEFECTEAVEGTLYYTVHLLENKIIQKQKDNSQTINDYEHNHVLRKTLTFYSGENLYQNPEIGRFVRKDFSSNYDVIWNPGNFEVLVLVHKKKGNDWEILHVVESQLEQ